MPPPPSNYGQWTLTMQVTGNPYPAQVTMGFSDTAGTRTAANFNATIKTTLTAGYAFPPLAVANFSSACEVIQSYFLLNRGGVLTSDILNWNTVGTKSINLTPANGALLVRKRTALAGVKYRGRNYWPNIWIDESNVDQAGNMSGTDFNSLQVGFGVGSGWLGSAIATGILPYILHTDPAINPDEILSYQLENKMATQRRRMRR